MIKGGFQGTRHLGFLDFGGQLGSSSPVVTVMDTVADALNVVPSSSLTENVKLSSPIKSVVGVYVTAPVTVSNTDNTATSGWAVSGAVPDSESAIVPRSVRSASTSGSRWTGGSSPARNPWAGSRRLRQRALLRHVR